MNFKEKPDFTGSYGVKSLFGKIGLGGGISNSNFFLCFYPLILDLDFYIFYIKNFLLRFPKNID